MIECPGLVQEIKVGEVTQVELFFFEPLRIEHFGD